MKTLIISLIYVASLGAIHSADAQVLKALGQKAKQKITQRADNKIDSGMDRGLDKVEEGAKKSPDETGDTDQTGANEEKGEARVTDQELAEPAAMVFNSKYDFVPGEQLIAFEDFNTTAIGDFPTRWNTNATAEVVTLNKKEGNWLKINKEGVFYPEFINDLPDNFTLEFDLGVNQGWAGTHFALNMARLDQPADFTDYYHYVNWKGNYAVHMELKPGLEGRVAASSRLQAGTNGNHTIDNQVDFKVWDNAAENFAHFALWRQKQRLRVYVNGEKIWDIPRAFEADGTFNAVTFAMYGSYQPEDYFLLGNIRMAIGEADTRNKLLTEGEFVTRGILFDVNSARIKPESAGALKDIAAVLKENPAMKVNIVGHTDSDGDDAANQALSEKRAAAVKETLVTQYGVSGDNLSTEGKGETELVDSSPTPEGKASNRRVVFKRE